jgi:iron complex outermembrane receptor protein
MPIKTIISAFFWVVIIQNSKAQNCNYTLRGSIIDYHNKTVLPGATVLISGSDLSAISEIDGTYSIGGLCEGFIELEVSHPECTSLIIPLRIEGNTVYDIKLEHHLEELDEVKVVGSMVREKTNSGLEETINLNILESFSMGNLGDALKELTGVSSLNTGSNIVKPSIHGLNGSRVLILNDGVRMQDMEWGEEHAPNIDINSAGAISVVKGAAALQYGGDAIGGTIVLEQEKFPLKDTLYGKTILNGVSNGRGGNMTTELIKAYNGGWFIKGQGAIKRMGDYETPEYVLSNTGMKELAASLQFGKHQFTLGWDARYSYFNTEISILRASHIGNVDDLIRSINGGEPQVVNPFTYDLQNPRQQVTHHLAKIKFYKRFEGIGRWDFQYDFQSNRRFEFDIRRGAQDDTPSIDLKLTTHTISTDFLWDSNEELKIHGGMVGRYQDNFANPDTGVRRLIPDYQKLDFGGFLIGEYGINTDLMMDAGIRYDFSNINAKKYYRTSRWIERGYDNEFQNFIVEDLGTQLLVNPRLNYHNLSATVGLKYEFRDYSRLKINAALAQRAPNPSELFSDGLHHSASRIELGDLRTKSETSNKISVSYEKDFNSWGFTFEPFANRIQNFILLEPTGVEYTIRGAFPVWAYSQTDARLLGLDLSVSANWVGSWQTDHKFSLVKGRDLINEEALINIPAANFRNKLIFSLPKWKNFETSLESQYVFRQNETPSNIMVYSPEQQQEVLLKINTPPDAYHLLAFSSKLEFPLQNGTKLTTTLIVNNLLNTEFRDYLNRQRFFADDLGRNIVFQLKYSY